MTNTITTSLLGVATLVISGIGSRIGLLIAETAPLPDWMQPITGPRRFWWAEIEKP